MAQSQQQQPQGQRPQRRHPIRDLLDKARGHQLAKRELRELENALVFAPQSDWDALHDAMDMYRVGQLTLEGYALLLWHRLEGHDSDVYAYYGAGNRQPVVWDGVQRCEMVQWNWLAADRWADWAYSADDAHDTRNAEREEPTP